MFVTLAIFFVPIYILLHTDIKRTFETFEQVSLYKLWLLIFLAYLFKTCDMNFFLNKPPPTTTITNLARATRNTKQNSYYYYYYA
jgi:hypothetical protein